MLWLPGPTHVRPEILAEFAIPPIGHRSAAMNEILERIDPHLRLAFGLESSESGVGVSTSSATALMEASLLGVGQRILCLVGGSFAKRWCNIAKTLGKDVYELPVDEGQVVNDMFLADVLDHEGPFDAITLILNETSNGTYTDPQPIVNVLQAFPDTMLLVDVVSLVAGAPIKLEESCIDFALAGVNKALALPPGASVFACSEAYVDRVRQAERKSWYLDPIRMLDGHRERKTPTTPTIPHYRALAKQLEDISAGVNLPAEQRRDNAADNWQARYDVHARMSDTVTQWAKKRGFEPFPDSGAISPTVACLKSSAIDSTRLVASALAAGEEIGGGYGPHKTSTFRIGHMGDHTEAELSKLLGVLDECCASLV